MTTAELNRRGESIRSLRTLTRRLLGSALCCLLAVLPAAAAPAAPVASGSSATHPTASPAPQGKSIDFLDIRIREISDTLFEIGEIRLDKAARTVTFPAKVSFRDGLAEYLIVSDIGKTYESVFSTAVRPYDLHVAMLLLGVRTAGDSGQSEPPAQLDKAYLESAPQLKGEEVEIWLTWKSGKVEQHARGEDCVFNVARNKPMSRGPWTYNGSVLHQGFLLAQTGGSIVALVTDPAALINNPRPGHTDDHIWKVQTKRLPPDGVTVQVTLKLAQPKAQGQ